MITLVFPSTDQDSIARSDDGFQGNTFILLITHMKYFFGFSSVESLIGINR